MRLTAIKGGDQSGVAVELASFTALDMAGGNSRRNKLGGKVGVLAVSPELTDIRVGLEYRVTSRPFPCGSLFANRRAYDVSQIVEFNRPSHGVTLVDRSAAIKEACLRRSLTA